MINPTDKDIGRSVVYIGDRYPGAKPERGVIVAVTDHTVFVRYGADKHSRSTRRENLDWAPRVILKEVEHARITL